jgi:hypothetical protein
MSEQVPGIDFERLVPWFREHVAAVDSLSATIVGHGRNIRPRTEVRGMGFIRPHHEWCGMVVERRLTPAPRIEKHG